MKNLISPTGRNKRIAILITAVFILTCGAASAQHLQWAEKIGNGQIAIGAMTFDANGNVLLAGSFLGVHDFDPDPNQVNSLLSYSGTYDAFIAKYTPGGNLVWVKSYGQNYDQGSPNRIKLDLAGNIFVTGIFESAITFPTSGTPITLQNGTGPINYDVYFAKFDNSGNPIWANALRTDSVNDVSGDIEIDSTGNVYITAGCLGRIAYGSGPITYTNSLGGSDIVLAKYNAAGVRTWIKRFGGTSNDIGARLELDPSGNILVTGAFSNVADFDPTAATYNLTGDNSANNRFFAKYTDTGNLIWAHFLKSTNSGFVKNIAYDPSGAFFLVGYNPYLTDFDPGPAVYNLPGGVYHYYVAKYNNAGNFLWAKSLVGPDYLTISSVDENAATHLTITGFYNDTVDFDLNPASTAYYYGDTIGSTPFMAVYDTAGNILGESNFYGSYKTVFLWDHFFRPFIMVSDINNNLFIGGDFIDTVDFDLGPLKYNLVSTDTIIKDAVLIKYDGIILNTGKKNTETSQMNVSVFPNPAQDNLNVVINGFYKKMDISIYDNLGRMHYKSETDKKNFNIDLSAFDNGMYYMKLSNQEYSCVLPVLVIH